MDLAHIGLRADADEVISADKALDDFAKSARDAERETDKFNKESSRASKTQKQLEQDLDRTNRTLKGMRSYVGAAVLAFAGFAGIGLTMGNFISATIESDNVQAQLAAGLKSTGYAAGQTIESLNKHAAALQGMSVFGDEYINTAQSILLTFTKITDDVFPKATAAILDYSSKMKVDLQAAALQVGKALNDPIIGMTALTRAGVQFTESQKDTVRALQESGNMAGAQAIILKELETQFGGSAKAARETFGGALKALGNAWGDLFEVSGPGVESLRVAIERLISVISDPAFMEFAATVGNAIFNALSVTVTLISSLVSLLPTLADHLLHLSPLMIAVFGPPVVSMVGTLSTMIGVTLFNSVKSLFLLLAANPITAVAVAIGIVLSYMVDWEKSIAGLIKIWGAFLYAWHSFWENEAGQQRAIEIVLNADQAVAELTASASEIKNNILRGFGGGTDQAAPKLKDAVASGGDAAAAKIGNAMEAAASHYADMNGRAVAAAGAQIVKGGQFVYNEATGEFKKAGQEVASSLEDSGKLAGEEIKSSMATGTQNFQNTFEGAGYKVGGVIADVLATRAQEIASIIVGTMRAELNQIRVETAKMAAEAQKILAEAENIRRGGRGGGGSSFSGGGSSGTSGSSGVSFFPTFSSPNPTIDDAANNNQPQTTTTTTEQPAVNLQVVNVWDPEDMINVIDTSAGSNKLLNWAKASRDDLTAILGI